MNRLFETYIKKVNQTDVSFVRNLMNEINWDARLIGLKGARGVGKTTLLLQRCKLYHKLDGSSLYVSVDNIWFSEHKLYDFASDFAKKGGRYLFLDEVHKYPNWSQELKNIYDDYPELNVVFTGSSLLEIINAKADLSRRAVVYEMQGFSFREYLNMSLKINLQSYSLNEILENHVAIAQTVLKEVKVLKYFEHYLKYGYYPYYNELPDLYYSRVSEVVNLIIETEIPLLHSVDVAYTRKIKQLLLIISESAPFVPNISKLSERIGITRNALLSYLNALDESRLIISAHKSSGGISALQKPDKIYLENTNLMYALSDVNVNIGNARETFFANQLRYKHNVNLSECSDFYIDNKYTFEIGGKDKDKKQINNVFNSYIAADNIEYGINEKIPLWIFGFLY